MALLDTVEVSVRFGGLQALDDVSIGVEAGHVTGIDRPERRRQDDAVQRHDRSAGPEPPAGSSSMVADLTG